MSYVLKDEIGYSENLVIMQRFFRKSKDKEIL